jgi:hypothetical protein
MNDPFAFDPEKDPPVAVEIRDGMVYVTLKDGRLIGNPLDWHPWLAAATPAQQANVELNPFSVDWVDLDEGLDIQGMLMGIHSHSPRTETEAP